ncbi:MAG: hypothetical protein ACR2RB_05030 [Gammaproteobacteria bacterium]
MTTLRTHLKFNGNQALNMILEQLAADPIYVATDEGRLIYNTTTRLVRYADNVQWRGFLISGLVTLADFAANVADTDGTLAADLDTRVATQRAVKTYIDNSLGLSDFWLDQGDIDASTNPNFPAAQKGHLYHITVAGNIGGAAGQPVQPGDIIISRIDANPAGDNATVGVNWMVRTAPIVAPVATDAVQGIVELATVLEASTGTDTTRAVTPAGLAASIAANVPALVAPNVPVATAVIQGKVELATVLEATTGTDTTRAVTPAGLAAALAGVGGAFVQAIAASAGATITAAVHGLGTLVKVVQVYEGTRQVGVDIDVNAAGDVTWATTTPITGSIIITG